MSKNLLQDMAKEKRLRKKEIQVLEPKPAQPQRVIRDDNLSGRNNRPRYMLWFVAVVSILFFLFALSYLFSKATVTINPKTQNLALNEDLSADKNVTTAGYLSFDLVVISGEKSKIVQTAEEKDISEKARGVVMIYNSYSSSSQTLNIDTRMEGSN